MRAFDKARRRSRRQSITRRGDVSLRSWRSRFTLLHATHTISEAVHGPAYTSHVATQEASFAIH